MKKSYIEDAGINDILVDEKNRNKFKVWVIYIIITSVIIFIIYKYLFTRNSQFIISKDKINTAVVEKQDLKKQISLEGKVLAYESRISYTKNSGIVKLLVNEGDQVTVDQVLAKIENSEIVTELKGVNLDINIAEAKLKHKILSIESKKAKLNEILELSEATLNVDKREADRAKEAFEKGAISFADLERLKDKFNLSQTKFTYARKTIGIEKKAIEFELEISKHEVNKLKMVVKELESKVDALYIKSIVNGTVGNLLVKQGEFVSVNKPIVRVVDLSKLEIEIEIPESYSNNIELNMLTTIKGAKDSWEGKIISLSPEVKSNIVLGRVRFLDSIPKKLRQNRRLIVDIELASLSNVLTIPNGKYKKFKKGNLIYIINNDYAEPREIRIGISNYERTEVISGLYQGETVITSLTEEMDGRNKIFITN